MADENETTDWTVVSGVTEVSGLDDSFIVDDDAQQQQHNYYSSSKHLFGSFGSSRSTNKIFGRKKEQELLEKVWERCCSSKDDDASAAAAEILWITGPSGAGKSFLLNSMRNHVVVRRRGSSNSSKSKPGGIFVSSKLDQLTVARREPFYAIVSALSDLCEIVSAEEKVKNGGTTSSSNIGEELRQELGLDFGLFYQFVPTMKQLLNLQNKSSSSSSSSVLRSSSSGYFSPSSSSEQNNFDSVDAAPTASSSSTAVGVQSMIRLVRACESFLSCISKHYPIFFILEDLQWADTDTIHLLQNLFMKSSSSTNLSNVCFALTAREGHVGTQMVSKTLFGTIQNDNEEENVVAAAEEKNRSSSSGSSTNSRSTSSSRLKSSSRSSTTANITTMKISNLTEDGVYQLLCSLLGYHKDNDEEEKTTTTNDHLKMKSFTKVVHAKTNGNPLFIVQYLEMLYSQNVLYYSDSKEGSNYYYKWDEDDLEKMTKRDISNDIIKSIDARVYNLDPTTRSALMIASHLGYKFRVDVLEMILRSIHSRMYRKETKKQLHERFMKIIHIAENASMLLRCGSISTTNATNSQQQNNEYYCFMHDRVQQCFYEMCPDDGGGAKERMYLNIARQLRPMLNQIMMKGESSSSVTRTTTDQEQYHHQDDDSLKFLITDMWNRGSTLITSDKEKIFMIQLNQEVSEIARRKSSFSSASHYLRVAINLLDKETMWSSTTTMTTGKEDNNKSSSSSYDLTLSLYSSFAQCTANAGDFDECHDAVEVILAHATHVLHKQSAYQARMHSLEVQGKFEEVVKIGLVAMKELGYPLSSKPGMMSIIFQVMRNKSRLNKTTDDGLLSLPRISDERHEAACNIMDALTSSAFIISPNTYMRNNQHALQGTLRDGISKLSPFAMAGLGLMEIAMYKNFENAARWATLSKMMIEKYGLYEAECGSLMISHFFALPFSRPWVESIEPLNRAFQSGLKYGKLHFCVSCLGMTCPMVFISKPLSEAEREIRNISSTQIHLLGPDGIYKFWTHGYWQQALNLMGASSLSEEDDDEELNNTVELTGEAMQEDEYVAEMTDAISIASFRVRKLELACYFRCHNVALQFTELLSKDQSSIEMICPLIVSKSCFGGITYLAEAKRCSSTTTKKKSSSSKKKTTRYYIKKANKCLKWLSNVVEKGCVDAKPFYLLLKADFEAFEHHEKSDKKKKTTSSSSSLMALFDSAIDAALECGFVGIAAFACEQACYALKDKNDIGADKDGCLASYWNKSIDFYRKWEAFGKVDQMMQQQQRNHEDEAGEIFTLGAASAAAPPSVVKVASNVT